MSESASAAAELNRKMLIKMYRTLCTAYSHSAIQPFKCKRSNDKFIIGIFLYFRCADEYIQSLTMCMCGGIVSWCFYFFQIAHKAMLWILISVMKTYWRRKCFFFCIPVVHINMCHHRKCLVLLLMYKKINNKCNHNLTAIFLLYYVYYIHS